MTGTGERRTSAWETLPSTAPESGPWPRDPTTSRSAPSIFAASAMQSTTSPCATCGRGVDAGLAGVCGCGLGDVLGAVALLDLEDRGAGSGATCGLRRPSPRAPEARLRSASRCRSRHRARRRQPRCRRWRSGCSSCDAPRVALELRARGDAVQSQHSAARAFRHRGARWTVLRLFRTNFACGFPAIRGRADSDDANRPSGQSGLVTRRRRHRITTR